MRITPARKQDIASLSQLNTAAERASPKVHFQPPQLFCAVQGHTNV